MITVGTVAGLMTNQNKNLVRIDIVNQTVDLWKNIRKPDQQFRAATLPGVAFMFEELLTSTAWYHGHIRVGFDCFEIKRTIFEAARLNVPTNCTYTHANFDSFLKPVDLLYADHCCHLDVKAVERQIKMATVSDAPCLFYSTYCLARTDYTKIGRRAGVSGTAKQIVEQIIEKKLKQARVKNWRRIYSVKYLGGKRGKVPMLTVGYLLNHTGYAPVNIDEIRIGDGTGRRTVKEIVKHKPLVEIPAHMLTPRIIQILKKNLTQSGHTLSFALANKTWRLKFIRKCMRRYGCDYQRPVGILNGLRRKKVINVSDWAPRSLIVTKKKTGWSGGANATALGMF